jgi:type I restriction enzyme R subunit
LGKMIAHYIVINETHKVMMICVRINILLRKPLFTKSKNSNDNATFGIPQDR